MKQALQVALSYFIVASLWILLSDQWFETFDILWFGLFDIQTIKGLGFVSVTAFLLYIMVYKLVRRYQTEIKRRKEKEERLLDLSKENNQFKRMIEQLSSGVILTDPNQTDNPIIFVNKGFEKMTGYTFEEIVGENPRFLQRDTARKSNVDSLNQAIQEGEAYETILPNYRKDESFFWNELKVTPIYDENNQLEYYIGIQDDVTDQKEQHRLIHTELSMFKEILSEEDETVLFPKMAQLIAEHLQADCLIYYQEDNERTDHCFYSKHLPQTLIQHFKDANDVNNELGTITHVDDLSQWNGDASLKDILISKYRSFWKVPIQSNSGECIGLFAVFFPHHVTEMPLDRESFSSYHSLIAIALQKSHYLHEIKEREHMYKLISEHASEMIILLDEQLNIEYISPSHLLYMGALHRINDMSDYLDASSMLEFDAFLDYVQRTDDEEMIEIQLFDQSGSTRWFEFRGSRFYDDDRQDLKILMSARDITERKGFEQALNHALNYDSLMRIPNRFYFKQLLNEFKNASDRRAALIVFDFDQMKDICNVYGQSAGDFVLIETRKRMDAAIDHEILARTGEDEFSIVLTDLESDQALKVRLQQILDLVREPFYFKGESIVATISVGATLILNQPQDQLMIEADVALRQARAHGKHQYHIYVEDALVYEMENLSLQNELYHALERDQFELYYQPIIDQDKRMIYGFEALIRWIHPEYGVISPYRFIPIAEETGWIVSIGEWVIKEACVQLCQWNDLGYDYNMSVNVSYRQLEEPDFLERVQHILDETNCPPDRLVFEITENILMKDLSVSLPVLQGLKKLRIKISIDDFGIGYSSLSYLKKFPIDILKIDRSFVQHIDEDNNDRAIVSAIMELSQSLNLMVVAEGIESKEHVELLRQLDCQLLQGYWFAKPIAPDVLNNEINKLKRII
ncbi:PAS domain S-box-containing protein/diguanylate cyclase (GGDEF) domain-containing protein [Pelagirhabdus alkalitolerans]|uniref:PAS domain S-box-containing protein/diguanylate cyclase (GGDEF) domain-containing protein n=1 Tax=Pelagirhabdus alkalitolerans TaxID=1612202 RepID=A0A1G6KLH8_9BACI|nr:EAL domain-containing protein [Pelagirhabdus alkalitolerans]SDC31929.1 PAS domain S-box-containing protein/diguanylate cyclase (GGDEF) domain-containing protein [Pelagirhabdus alkalitolerans]